jgi:hypothetical protein
MQCNTQAQRQTLPKPWVYRTPSGEHRVKRPEVHQLARGIEEWRYAAANVGEALDG